MSEVRIITGDCREALAGMEPDSFDAAVTDPPYHLTSIVKRFGSETAAPAKSGKSGVYARSSAGFMGQKWDGGDVAFRPETWAEVLRVLKPGAHLLAFSGSRTYHRMACAVEDAGFEIRDCIFWCYGSGFPKSHDVSKALDKMAGAEREVVGRNPNGRRGEPLKFHGNNARPNLVGKFPDITAPATDLARQWQGWGTALKPSLEPIVLARKPLAGTVAENVARFGTGALNIDGCRIQTDEDQSRRRGTFPHSDDAWGNGRPDEVSQSHALGRWPANLVHDGSGEVLAGFPAETRTSGNKRPTAQPIGFGGSEGRLALPIDHGDSGSAARFFYCAKATKGERGEGNLHPTVKPLALMRWLCRLVTPPGGHVLDPFAGSGSTGLAADQEGFRATLIEMSPEYAEIIRRRLRADAPLFAGAAE